MSQSMYLAVHFSGKDSCFFFVQARVEEKINVVDVTRTDDVHIASLRSLPVSYVQDCLRVYERLPMYIFMHDLSYLFCKLKNMVANGRTNIFYHVPFYFFLFDLFLSICMLLFLFSSLLLYISIYILFDVCM
jgi:hypothetical protein